MKLTANLVNYQPSWFCEEYVLDGKDFDIHLSSLAISFTQVIIVLVTVKPGSSISWMAIVWVHLYPPPKLTQNTNKNNPRKIEPKLLLPNISLLFLFPWKIQPSKPTKRTIESLKPVRKKKKTSLNGQRAASRWSIRGLTLGSRQSTTSIQWNAEWRHGGCELQGFWGGNPGEALPDSSRLGRLGFTLGKIRGITTRDP